MLRFLEIRADFDSAILGDENIAFLGRLTSQKFPFIFNGRQSLRKSPCNMTAT
jgi:hypothetical protein